MKGIEGIHNFVQDILIRIGDKGPLTNQDSLFLSGRLQSIDAVEIVVYLEENFGVDFGQIGFNEEQIDSIDAIYALSQTAKN
jgi:acyl carrier protein